MCVMHQADNAFSIRSTWLCYQLVRFSTVAYNSKHCVLDLSLIDLPFSPISMCHFDSAVSLGVELDNQVSA